MSPTPECVLIEQRLPRVLEDDLPVGETALVLAHVDSCASCAAARARFVATRAAVRDARPDDSDFAALRARVVGELAPRSRWERVTPRAALAAAAMIALAIGSVFVAPSALERADLSSIVGNAKAALPAIDLGSNLRVEWSIPSLSDLGADR
ncbi:MAG: zf-HC2 domain-containing protein [Planctomycetes bacterium]|nr:zf-HC2 domain-containing protein [Planctomycetota bacterium]